MLIEKLAFRPLQRTETRTWRNPRRFDFLDDMRVIPLSDPEVLQTAHQLPILLDLSGPEPALVAAVASELLRQPAADENGAWTRGYLPVALRCLPFALDPAARQAGGRGRLLVAETLLDEGGHPIFAAEGALTPEVARLSQLLAQAALSSAESAASLEPLLLADIFTPVGREDERLHTVNAEALHALSALRASLIVKSSLSSAQILFAMLFSRRLLNSQVTFSLARNEAPQVPTASAAGAPFTALEYLDFAMDESDMVPIDVPAEGVS